MTDTSGASVPGAIVTVVNTGTNETHSMKSDAAGNYSFVNLVPANYKIEVEAANFKRFVRVPVQVQVGSSVRIDTALEIGATSETVEVSTQVPLLQTDSGQMSQQVEGTTVQEMPLNGRNPLNLIALTAGVVPQGASMGTTAANQNSGNTQNQGWGNYQIGGGLSGQSAQYVDGVATNVLGNTVAFVPTQDAVQEFNVASNSVSADFGRFAGGVVNMTTKSGANQWHGAAYEYLRNTALNANQWFNKKNQLAAGQANKPVKLNQNQYGISASGPIVKDKAFFMFTWEKMNIRFAQGSPTYVPTTSMKAGKIPLVKDASGTITNNFVDPLGNCVPKNAATYQTDGYFDISNCTFNTASKAFLDYFPDSNTGTSTYYYRAVNIGNDQRQYNGRVDYNLSANQRLFGRYSYWNLGDISFNQFPEVTKYNTGNGATLNTTHMLVLGDTYTINPTTILDVRMSWIREAYMTTKPTTNADLTKFFPGASFTSQQAVHLLPTFSLNNKRNFYSAWARGPFGGSTLTNYQVSANLVKIHGHHTFKFGTEIRQMDSINTGSPNGGSYAFNGNYTGDEWSDFLLGYAKSGSLNLASRTAAYNYYQAYYAQDTWQFNNKLTLNLGLRWELPGSIGEKRDKLLVLLPTTVDPYTGVAGTLGLTNSGLYGSRTIQPSPMRLFAPRIGFAYRLNGNTVIRGGYGVSYVPPDIFSGAAGPDRSSINSASTPLNNTLTLNPANVAAGNFILMNNPYPGGLIAPSGRSDQTFMTKRMYTSALSGAVASSIYPYMQQWNMSISRQMKGNWMIDVGYAGSKGTHMASIAGGMNQLPSIYWGSSVSAADAALNTSQNVTLTTPINFGSAATRAVTLGQSRRPYKYYSNFTNATPFWGATTYNSLQVKAEKRFKSGGIIMGSYTWSKMIGDTDSQGGSYLEAKASAASNTAGFGAIQDNDNHIAERSILSYNVPSRAVVSYVMPLPFGDGKKYLSNLNGVVSRIVSGWAVNGIVTLQTGFSLGLQEASSNNLTKDFGYGQLRPDVVAGCKKTVDGTTRDRLNKWFNTSCFQAPGTAAGKVGWALGNSPRVDGSLKSEGIDNWDLSILKSTKIWERSSLEFRAEFFNLFNRTQFAPPYVWDGQPALFGTIADQANKPRFVQASLRLKF